MICDPLLGPYWLNLLHSWLAPVPLLIDMPRDTCLLICLILASLAARARLLCP